MPKTIIDKSPINIIIPIIAIVKIAETSWFSVREDTKRHIFAQWHDESYLNKWCVLHSELVDKKYIMTVYKDDVDLYRFVYLRNKLNYSIDKRTM